MADEGRKKETAREPIMKSLDLLNLLKPEQPKPKPETQVSEQGPPKETANETPGAGADE